MYKIKIIPIHRTPKSVFLNSKRQDKDMNINMSSDNESSVGWVPNPPNHHYREGWPRSGREGVLH